MPSSNESSSSGQWPKEIYDDKMRAMLEPEDGLNSDLPITEKVAQRFSTWIMQNAKTSIAVALLVLFSFVPGMFSIQTDFSPKSWLNQHDPDIKVLENFEAHFGSEDSIVLAMHSENGIFTPASIKALYEITEAMWKVPDIIRVDSLSNFYWSYGQGDDLITEAFLPEDELDRDEISNSWLLEKRKAALEHRSLPGYLISKDAKSALIFGRLVARENINENYKAIYDSVKGLGDRYTNNDLTFYVTGQPALTHLYQKYSFVDIKTLTPIMFGLVIAFLIYSFRSLVGILVPMIVILSTLTVMLGFIGYMQIKINSLAFILPSIIVAIGIADSIHLLNTFYERYIVHKNKNLAVQESLVKNFWPIFLTSFSTSIGFLSLMPSDIYPVSTVGLIAGFSTMMAFAFTCFLVCPMLLLINVKRPTFTVGQKTLPRHLITKYLNYLQKHYAKINVIFVLVSLSGIALGLMNQVNSNPYKYFRPNNELTIANNFVLKEFNGATGPQILIDSGEVDGVKDPSFLKRVVEFEAKLKAKDYINTTVSVTDILKEMNQSLFGGDPTQYKINDNRKTIAEQLFLYTMGLPEGLDIKDRVDLENRRLRINVMWSLQDSKNALAAMEDIEAMGAQMGVHAKVTGKSMLFQRMNNYVVTTFLKSMSFALLLITALLIIVFKHLRNGLFSIIPNFVPITLGAGLLTMLGFNIDVSRAIVASVTLGIAVDDTIHFLSHYNKLHNQGVSCFDALEEVLSSTGLALIITTLILVFGFGIFMAAEIVPNANFGVLAAFVLSIALLCDVVFLPTLILWRARVRGEA